MFPEVRRKISSRVDSLFRLTSPEKVLRLCSTQFRIRAVLLRIITRVQRRPSRRCILTSYVRRFPGSVRYRLSRPQAARFHNRTRGIEVGPLDHTVIVFIQRSRESMVNRCIATVDCPYTGYLLCCLVEHYTNTNRKPLWPNT